MTKMNIQWDIKGPIARSVANMNRPNEMTKKWIENSQEVKKRFLEMIPSETFKAYAAPKEFKI